MRTSGRRHLDAVILGLGGLACGAVAALGGVAGDTERVTGMWVGASLSDDGGAAITEVIDYDFGLAQGKHGIFRQIPGLSTDSLVKVASDERAGRDRRPVNRVPRRGAGPRGEDR